MKRLGPGLIPSAADDDPSGIPTYTQAGAQFGFGILWTMLLAYPLMVAIQSLSARLGRVTARGLATNLRRHHPAPILYAAVIVLPVANTINIAADLAAMGADAKLVLAGPVQLYFVRQGTTSLPLQVFVTYERYARLLKWLTRALFAYMTMVFVVIPVDWKAVGLSIVKPPVSFTGRYLTTVVAVLGTTISPYLFFWHAPQEVEEIRSHPSQQSLLPATAGQCPTHADQHRHVGRYGAVGCRCVFHHAVCCCDAACPSCRGENEGRRCQRTQTDRWRDGVCPLQSWNCRDRATRIACPRWIGSPRDDGGDEMAQ
jgi:Mn2+/Fe2+ NRAMP family transporter